MKPNIYMFHRVELGQKQDIAEVYYSRGMVHKTDEIFLHIDRLLEEGKQFGSIEQCAIDTQYFHLSFDDGYKEHLIVAHKLKERYSIEKNKATFSVNCGNSYTHEHTGMDVVYAAIMGDNLNKITSFFGIPKSEKNLEVIKQKIIRQSPHQLKEIPDIVPGLSRILSCIFLEKDDIREISKIFNIACHGMTHRDMTNHITDSEIEMQSAKELLEHELNIDIETFTYPEGKNNDLLRETCKACGFHNGLSISHRPGNSFCIGRKII